MAYKSVIQLNVISDEPIPNNMTFQEIIDACDAGTFIGTFKSIIRNQKIETLNTFLKNLIGFKKKQKPYAIWIDSDNCFTYGASRIAKENKFTIIKYCDSSIDAWINYKNLINKKLINKKI